MVKMSRRLVKVLSVLIRVWRGRPDLTKSRTSECASLAQESRVSALCPCDLRCRLELVGRML